MSPSDVAVLLALVLGAIGLAALNAWLQRLARPDVGTERVAGCCGMALPSEIAAAAEEAT